LNLNDLNNQTIIISIKQESPMSETNVLTSVSENELSENNYVNFLKFSNEPENSLNVFHNDNSHFNEDCSIVKNSKNSDCSFSKENLSALSTEINTSINQNTIKDNFPKKKKKLVKVNEKETINEISEHTGQLEHNIVKPKKQTKFNVKDFIEEEADVGSDEESDISKINKKLLMKKVKKNDSDNEDGEDGYLSDLIAFSDGEGCEGSKEKRSHLSKYFLDELKEDRKRIKIVINGPPKKRKYMDLIKGNNENNDNNENRTISSQQEYFPSRKLRKTESVHDISTSLNLRKKASTNSQANIKNSFNSSFNLFKKEKDNELDAEEEDYDDQEILLLRNKAKEDKIKKLVESMNQGNSSLKKRIKENEQILENVEVINKLNHNEVPIQKTQYPNFIFNNYNKNANGVQGIQKNNSFLHAMKTGKTLYEVDKKDLNLELQRLYKKNVEGSVPEISEAKRLNPNLYSMFNNGTIDKAKPCAYLDSMFKRNNRSKVKLSNKKNRSKYSKERAKSELPNKTKSKNLIKSNNKKKESEIKPKKTENRSVYKKY